jgi:hypothetical protein
MTLEGGGKLKCQWFTLNHNVSTHYNFEVQLTNKVDTEATRDAKNM